MTTGADKKQESSLTLLVCTQSRAGFPSWFRVPLTSLPTQNRLYSVNTSISEGSDLGVPLLIGGFVQFHKDMPLSVSAYGLPHIFLPLPASFRSACHARRFQPRCSHAALYIHYKKASQHWGTATPNYDLLYRTLRVDKARTFLPLV